MSASSDRDPVTLMAEEMIEKLVVALTNQNSEEVMQILDFYSGTSLPIPLGAVKVKVKIKGYAERPVLIESTTFFTDQVFNSLLKQCLDQDYPVETIRFNGSNVLHWVMGTSMRIGDEAELQRMLNRGFPVEELDSSENPPCSAASMAIRGNKVNGFKLCMAGYSQEGLDRERVILEEAISTFAHRSKINQFLDILREKETELLTQDLELRQERSAIRKNRL